MADRAIERRRIADQRLDDQGGERERQRKRERHDAGLDWIADVAGVHLSRRRARSRPPARARARPSPGSTSRRASIRTPIPCPILSPKRGRGCPKAARSRELEAAAARRYGAAAASVVAGPGSQALIQALSHILPHGAVGALGPTYGGFASAFAAAGARVVEAKRLEDMGASTSPSWSIPTTRTGGSLPRAALLALHARLAGAAAADRRRGLRRFRRRGEPCAIAARERAVVLRSFGKAYGLAGLRLGFALASPDIVPSLRAALGPWPVSGPAIAIGVRALADSDWLEATRARLAKEAARLDALLHGAGWRIIGGTRLFRLAAHADARAAFERLLAAGILARPFADTSGLAAIRDSRATRHAWERLGRGAAE